MRFNELVRILKSHDCSIVKHGKKHDHWKSPMTGKVFQVGRHGNEEVKTGTLESILKDAGIK